MNILFLCNKFPYPPKDGGQIMTFFTIKGMAENGNTVTVASINTKKHFFDLSKMPESVSVLADFHAVYENTDITALGTIRNLLFSRLPYTATRFYTKGFCNLLRGLFAEKQFDIVQLEGLYLCQYIPLIKECSQARITYKAHNVEYEIWQRLATAEKNPLKKWYLRNLAKRVERYERSVLNRYDFLMTATKRDRDSYVAMGNTKPTFVAPTGIFPNELPQTTKGATRENITLFHLGALDWAPNQQGLLWFIENCWEQIRAENPKVELHVAGRNAPQWIIDRLSAIEGIVYDGEVPDAYAFMNKHSVMIVPLLAGSGIRIKILEGLSFGKTIVSTSIGAEGIPAKQGEEIFIADTPQGFIDTIRHIAQRPETLTEIGRNAQEFVKANFDTREICKQTVEFYNRHLQ